MSIPEANLPANVNIIDSIQVTQVQETMRKISQFQMVIRNTLREGHDYGTIPGTGSKPTLLKPGAEKILMLMGLTSEYELIERIQDYETGFFAFTVRCTIYRQGTKITEGLGHANTRERRYTSGRQQDAYTLANTVLKMAKKRAQVDAVLTVASLSELFTQDLEDLVEEGVVPETASVKRQASGSEKANAEKITESQLKAIFGIARNKNISKDYIDALISEQYGVSDIKALTKAQASEIISYLQSQATGG